jgi:hypothetical protein
MLRPAGCAFVLVSAMLVAATSPAQNVTGYDAMANPYLLLLREPAVIADLKLSETQRRDLRRLNDEVDGPFLAMRNKSDAESQTIWEQLLKKTEQEADEILDVGQRKRLSQIMLRVQGVRLVLTPKVTDRLDLSTDQKASIEESLDETKKELTDLQKKLNDGESRQRIEPQIRRATERTNKQVFTQLTSAQQRTLTALLGRRFDANKLGRTSFKAPELVESGGWINSEPLRLEDLRGKVIALHFWAFG